MVISLVMVMELEVIKKNVSVYFAFAKNVFTEFSNDNAMKLSASLSYYTIFSLAPMLVVIISVAGIFLGKDAIQGEIYGQIKWLIGTEAAKQVQELIKNAELSNKSGVAAVVGSVTLLIGATGVFAEIQDSINFIWSLKAKPKNSWLKYLTNRFLSFSLIITLGFLLIVSLLANAFIDIFSGKLKIYFAEATVYLFSIVNFLIVLLVISTLFAIIFKVLPDGKIRWKDAFVGASATAVLFMIGKSLIGFYLGQSNIGGAFGAAGSVIIILLWVYYSSIILFLGAEFTKVYTQTYGKGIQPNEHAVLLIKKEVEWNQD
ncbi:MAG: YihY/virulence factor BrkB family protein [Arcicella sp.]|jgi:membrane protein|nr:YihY/virulence factor BrkB family protein [Arcicella sp.]